MNTAGGTSRVGVSCQWIGRAGRDDRHQAPAYDQPLPLSIPLDRQRHRGQVPLPWLRNLLPDREAVLVRWRRAFTLATCCPTKKTFSKRSDFRRSSTKRVRVDRGCEQLPTSSATPQGNTTMYENSNAVTYFLVDHGYGWACQELLVPAE